MKKIIIEIEFDDTDGYKGHGDDTAELIEDSIKRFMEIDLEGDKVIQPGWSVYLI